MPATNDHKLKMILAKADKAYMGYLKQMKTLEKQARDLLAELEREEVTAVRSKIKKLK